MEFEKEEEHLDPTSEITIDIVKERAVKGVAILTGRTFILNLISLGATGLLTVFLDPSEFGIFFIVSAIVNFLAYFSDVGLAAALIQKKEKVSDTDLKTTFTIQQLLVLVILTTLFAATPVFQKYYHLNHEGQFLLYALGLSLLFSSLKTIPSALLERKLDFTKLVIPQILENIFYNLTAVFFAWKGFGIRTFTYAVLIRGIVGLVAIYVLNPWRPGIAFSKESIKKLLKFGLPYQMNTFLAAIKDDGMTAFLGGILGSYGVGILGWAQKWSYYPLRLFLDQVLKVSFPAFSRMQENKEELKRTLTRSIFFVCFFVFPIVTGLLLLAPLLIKIIPRYSKWQPALIPLALISVNTFFAASTSQLTNLLNAIGKIKTTFKLMIMWTALTWLFVPFLSIKFGFNGAALGYALVGFSSVVAISIAKKYVDFSIYESMVKPFYGSLIMAVVLFAVKSVTQTSIYSLVALVLVGSIAYFSSMYLLVGESLVVDAKKGLRAVFGK